MTDYLAVETMLLPRITAEQFKTILSAEKRIGIKNDFPWSNETIEKLANGFLVPDEIVKHVLSFSFSSDTRVYESYFSRTRTLRER